MTVNNLIGNDMGGLFIFPNSAKNIDIKVYNLTLNNCQQLYYKSNSILIWGEDNVQASFEK